jgi:hypothetical protein
MNGGCAQEELNSNPVLPPCAKPTATHAADIFVCGLSVHKSPVYPCWLKKAASKDSVYLP